MKHFPTLLLALLLSLIVLLTLPLKPAAAHPESLNSGTPEPALEAESAILIEQKSGKILYQKNAYKKMYPASTTKILTALVAIENGELDEVVTVGEEANLVHGDGSKAGLDLKEKISLRNLIYGLLLPSGNDAAYTIAVHIGRKISNDETLGIKEALEEFCTLMNERAKKAGAKSTHFVNPHGYHNENHYTTAYDLAMISRAAMEHEFFRNVVKTELFTIEDWNGFDKKNPEKKEIRYWRNTNYLINKKSKYYYPYATGIKTGYTSAAGHCLVSSATKDGLDLIAVVLNSSKEGKWEDSTKLLEYGFENFRYYQVVEKGQVLKTVTVENCDPEDSGQLQVIVKDGFGDIFNKNDIPKIKKTIEWNERLLAPPTNDGYTNTRFVAPVIKGQVLGKVVYTLNEEIIFESPLLASRDVKEKKNSINPFKTKKENPEEDTVLFQYWWIIPIFIIAVAIRRIYVIKKRQKRIFYRKK